MSNIIFTEYGPEMDIKQASEMYSRESVEMLEQTDILYKYDGKEI